MLTLTAGQQAALEAGRCVRRTFIWSEPRDPSSPGVDPVGLWDDVGAVSISGRTYYGSGNVARVDTLSAKSDVSIPSLQIVLSGIATEATQLIRGEIVSQAKIEVSIGIYDPATRALIDGLIPRFIGVIDDVEIKTPAAGGTSDIILTCESISRALTIRNTSTRSGPDQDQRSAIDEFLDYTGAQRERTIYFMRRDPNSSNTARAH